MESIKNYGTMTAQEKWNMLAAVANLYYNSGLTQNQIAERLYTSRSKVSRMLKEARDLGIVEVTIREPWDRNLEYEQQIKERFSLTNIRVINTKKLSDEDVMDKITEAASYYLDSIIKEGMVVGISWGYTLYRIVMRIDNNNRKNIPVTVVPIMGAATIKNPERDSLDLAKELASAYGGEYRYIYAPLFVKKRDLRESLISEDNIKEVLDLSRAADVILTSVGSIASRSWDNYLGNQTLDRLEKMGAVGHIGGHFYDLKGQELRTSLPECMIGLSLDEIKKCPEVVCVACGPEKVEPVKGALCGGFIDTLIVDENCAQRILA